ncbi:unnamed protein product [Pleuronectes platessa]|uniref:Uncharacterized protein n=1 Tax=Pleuronectes platessa TaxID=8262 RepID=A0A9N7VGE6_PLEPL|nr:unnamed protein product [Pleuronectes platessa]
MGNLKLRNQPEIHCLQNGAWRVKCDRKSCRMDVHKTAEAKEIIKHIQHGTVRGRKHKHSRSERVRPDCERMSVSPVSVVVEVAVRDSQVGVVALGESLQPKPQS